MERALQDWSIGANGQRCKLPGRTSCKGPGNQQKSLHFILAAGVGWEVHGVEWSGLNLKEALCYMWRMLFKVQRG